jgi:peptidoglycan hydrolase CwlO-like protein
MDQYKESMPPEVAELAGVKKPNDQDQTTARLEFIEKELSRLTDSVDRINKELQRFRAWQDRTAAMMNKLNKG